jgi:SagB-type dehydrogenase family enzyme
MGLVFQIDYDFDDAAHNRLLGLDPEREAVYAQVTVWPERRGGTLPYSVPDLSPERFGPVAPASGLSARHDVVYAEIQQIQRASLVFRPAQVPTKEALQVTATLPPTWRTLPPHVRQARELAYDEAVVQRRSKRNFVDHALPEQAVVNLLHLACDTLRPAEAGPQPSNGGLQVGFLSGSVTGLAPGMYLLDSTERKIGCWRTGLLTPPMATVCLDQHWLKNAGLHFLLMVNLEALDRFWGGRGYRYAMLEAGRLGQSLYLGATALGLGCCGIGALYDDEARRLLDLTPDSALVYLVAVGPVRG